MKKFRLMSERLLRRAKALLAKTQTVGRLRLYGLSLLTLIMLISTISISMADAISFDATVDTARVSLDQVMQLTLTITGVSDNLDPVSLPVIDGFSAKYLGPSTSVSIVNGDYHSERSFIYNLFPNKAGQFQIPPISATIQGHTYSTKPISVEVFTSSAQAQAANSANTDQGQVPNTDSLKNKIVIKASVDSTDVYLNERVPLTIRLFISDVSVRDIQYPPQLDKQGIIVDDYEKPLQGSDVINGVKYDIYEFKTNIYPNQLGDLTLGPVQIQMNVLYKTGQTSPFGGDNSVFGADVFNNFFDSYAARPVTISSDPIKLHVSSLPPDNRPADFSGAIGKSFDFQASVSPLQVKAGDPLTLKMDIKGDGNFKDFKMPVFNAVGFKTYEPKIKNTGNEKTAELVIIPTSVNVKQVPAISFSYFDTSLKDYKTITQGPFAIQVTSPSPDQDFKAVGFTDISRGPVVVPTNQFSLGKLFIKIFKGFLKLTKSIWFWIGLGIVFVVGLAYFIWRKFQDRLENDPAFARRLKAVREAKKALKPAEGYIAAGKSKDFYALITKVLHDYLANKWHQSSAALTIEEISEKLKETKVDENSIGQIRNVFSQSDLVCFAGAACDADRMRADLKQTQDLIAQLQKFLK